MNELACRRHLCPAAPPPQVHACVRLLRQHAVLQPPLAADGPAVCALYLTNSAAYVVGVLAALKLG